MYKITTAVPSGTAVLGYPLPFVRKILPLVGFIGKYLENQHLLCYNVVCEE